jgi:GTP-binding protein HflX
MLFATLDPTTRMVNLPGGREVLLTDTVGFIQKLPTQIVAAFRATLEEIADADMLLHVVDATHPNAAAQIEAVEDTLALLELDHLPLVVALNKVDQLPADSDPEWIWGSRNRPYVFPL